MASQPVTRPTLAAFTDGQIEQNVRAQILSQTLSKNNVPTGTADTVAQQHLGVQTFVGYVTGILTLRPGLIPSTYVGLSGKWQTGTPLDPNHPYMMGVYFPPNDPKYLPEFIRAQNHPHLRVSMDIDISKGTVSEAVIQFVWVLLDYNYPTLPYDPPFDVREIKQGP